MSLKNTSLKATTFKQLRRHSPSTPGLQPDDPMSEAGRKLMAFHFNKLCQSESRVRKGSDPEAIHTMRVTSRRLRSILALFEPYFHEDALNSYEKTLRHLARWLGEVRDREVMSSKARQYLANHPGIAPKGLNMLIDDWQDQIKTARNTLLDLLDSERYGNFTLNFAKFVMEPGKDALKPRHGESLPTLVRQVAPSAIYEHLAAVRAYEPVMPTSPLTRLHALRIEAKRLRYTLESFKEVLAPDAQAAIDATIALQDYLGNLHDADVTSGAIAVMIDSGVSGKALKALLAYKSASEEEKARLVAGVSDAWATFTDPAMRRALALGVAIL